ncbi:uncharacterized protein LOC131681575 [Topomyia yanbarensis]|uniref:uncharacterized protein LOC131681575 n=1 Tax=Topomyia yanbarensis TaxID=2498891 RepID=UPI00273A8EEF|nr:uncharacterized protein LOC131681575 [Topomyia yanbarensis]XP_058818413.1 uncharacterized protein LOC131681575 [Topomyia yanbarensis]
MASGEISFPMEIGSIESTCIICFDVLKWAVFCDRCKQSTCYECIGKWLEEKHDCPKCRRQCRLEDYTIQKEHYSCKKDGLLLEYYCDECDQCFCRKCLGKDGPHFRHPVRSLDVLRKETIDAVDVLKKMNSRTALENIKALIAKGEPQELVLKRKSVEKEIDKVMTPAGCPTPKYRLPNATFFEARTNKIAINTSTLEKCVATDGYGNSWELTVHPYGVSEAKQKFISVYLKLVNGTPMRYEYKFSMYSASGTKRLAKYYAVDDFGIGSESKGCQRLIWLEAARSKVHDLGYQIIFGTCPTNMAYSLRCAANLIINKSKRLEFEIFAFRVLNFEENKKNNAIMFSKIMYDQQNIAWRLRVDCNGHQEQDNYISAYIELLNGAKGWFDVFIEMVHPYPPQSIKRQLTHEFDVHSNWGIPHFVDQYRTREFLNEGNLLFNFGTRPAHIEQEAI